MKLDRFDTFLLGVSLSAIIMLVALQFVGENKTEQEQIIFQLETENGKLFDELIKWEDHAIRMKRICGLPDTVTWSYKQKVIHCVDLKSLENYKD